MDYTLTDEELREAAEDRARIMDSESIRQNIDDEDFLLEMTGWLSWDGEPPA